MEIYLLTFSAESVNDTYSLERGGGEYDHSPLSICYTNKDILQIELQ